MSSPLRARATSTRRHPLRTAAPLCLAVGSLSARATALLYSGATDGNWSNAANWGGTAPGSGTTLTDLRLNVNSSSAGLNYTAAQGTTVLDISTVGGENRAIGIGALSDAANGQLNVTGGTLQILSEGTAAAVMIGSGLGAGWAGTASLNVSGGTLSLPGASSAIAVMTRGAAGASSTFTVSGSGSVLADIVSFGELSAIPAAGAVATVNLNGGTLQTRVIFERNAVTSAFLNLNGGTLVSNDTNHDEDWIRSVNGGPVTTLLAGGVTINTNGQDNQRIQVGIAGTAGGDIAKAGAGRLVLQGASTFDGDVNVNSEALRVTNATALGNTTGGTAVTGGARLELSGGITVTGETVTINGGGGAFTINGSSAGANSGALQSAAGVNVWNGPVILGSSTPRVGAQRTATLDIRGAIANGASSDLVVRNEDNSNPTTDASRGITIVSTPAGVNTYTGNTDVFRGYLRLGANDTLPTGTTVRLGTSGGAAFIGILDLNGFSQTVAGLTTGPGGVAADQFVTNNGAGAGTLTVNNASAMTYGGVIKNGATLAQVTGFTKGGAGTFTLSNTHTYTGATTVNAGTLRLAGGRIEGSSQIIINSGGVLRDESAGTGTIGDGATVTINAGGIFHSLQNEYTGALAGDGNWLFDNTGAALDMAVTPGAGQHGVFNGTITQTGTQPHRFTKLGAGTQSLGGVNTYRGPTWVNAGTLRVTSGNEATLGAPSASASALLLNGGALQVSSASLTLNDPGRGLGLGAGGGALEVDTGLTLALFNDISGGAGILNKRGAGTFNLTANALVNALSVQAGTYRQSAGSTSIQTSTGGLTILDGAAYHLAAGTLKTDRITMSGSGTFAWGAGRLTHFASVGSTGTTDISSPGYQSLLVGTTAEITGDLTSSAGSVLMAHGSPTFYLNGGVRFNNFSVDGDVNLSAAGDILEVEITPFLLRPVSGSLGTNAVEYGSIPLLTWTGTLSGTFDTFVGVGNDGRGFSPSATPVTSAASLAINTYYLEYDTTDRTLWFHFKVAGYVPEPGPFALLGVGAFTLRALHRRRHGAPGRK